MTSPVLNDDIKSLVFGIQLVVSDHISRVIAEKGFDYDAFHIVNARP